MFGVGVDIIEIDRVGSVLDRRGRFFRRRVYLEHETRYCESRRDPVPHFAARFAAKEAVMKALMVPRGTTFLWRDIEILRGGNGAPSVRLSGRARKLADEHGISRIAISLSHSDTHAVAMAVAAR